MELPRPQLPEEVQQLFPYKSNWLSVSGLQMHYIDHGGGPAVLMLHGNPTWSFFYRSLVGVLSANHRCIAPDHIGMGLSEKPQETELYRLQAHIHRAVELVEALKLEHFDLIVHDWGGAIGMGLAKHFPERVGRIVVMNTAAFRSPHIPLRIALCKTPLLGAVLVRGLNAFALPATWMAAKRPLPAAVRRAYLFPYGNYRDRIATHRFVMDIPLRPSHASYAPLKAVEEGLVLLRNKPMLLLWGMRDFCFDVRFLREWQARFPEAKTVELPVAGHYLLEDEPEHCCALIQDFLARSLAGQTPL